MSGRLLRAALEQDAPAAPAAPQTIEMKGPLAEIYRKALDVAYAKQDTVTGEDTVGQVEGATAQDKVVAPDAVANESQANDALTAQYLASLMPDEDGDTGEQDGQPSAVMTVYGVSDADLSEEIVVDVTKHLAQKSPERDFVLIVDATQNGSHPSGSIPERMVMLGRALEAVTEAHGGRVFKNLGELQAHIGTTHQFTSWKAQQAK